MSIFVKRGVRVFPQFSEEDCDLNAFRWWTDRQGYAKRDVQSNSKKKTVYAHRIVFERKMGRPVGRWELCDHIHGNKLDLRRSELRLVSAKGNAQNIHVVRSKSGFFGVTWHKKVGKWQASIESNGKSNYLGLFADKLDAARAYNAAAEKFGFLTRNRFPEELAA